MHSEEIEQFLYLVLKIIEFLKEEFKNSYQIQYVIKLLHYYLLLSSFLRISKVNNKAKYE